MDSRLQIFSGIVNNLWAKVMYLPQPNKNDMYDVLAVLNRTHFIPTTKVEDGVMVYLNSKIKKDPFFIRDLLNDMYHLGYVTREGLPATGYRWKLTRVGVIALNSLCEEILNEK